MVSAGAVTFASAQDGPGLRPGLSAGPDQFFFGGHYVTRPIWDRMRFQPDVEAGFGNDLTVEAFNVEFAYWMPIGADWHAYAGGGPAMPIRSISGVRVDGTPLIGSPDPDAQRIRMAQTQREPAGLLTFADG